MSGVSEQVLDGLGPAIRDAAGDLLEPLVEGYTSQLATTDDLLQPTTSRWARVYDLDTTPQPGWLGQATGTKVPAGLTTEQERAYVRDQAAWRRGRLDALGAAIQTVLSGDKRIGFLERVDSPWRITIQVYSPDAVGVTEDQIRAAATTQKAVGLVIDDVQFIDPVTYEQLAALYATYEDLEAAWPTFPVAPERDLPNVRWWRPAGHFLRYARLPLIAATYDDLKDMFPTYRALRDYDPTQEV